MNRFAGRHEDFKFLDFFLDIWRRFYLRVDVFDFTLQRVVRGTQLFGVLDLRGSLVELSDIDHLLHDFEKIINAF